MAKANPLQRSLSLCGAVRILAFCGLWAGRVALAVARADSDLAAAEATSSQTANLLGEPFSESSFGQNVR